MGTKLNRRGARKARELIGANQYVLESSWSEAKPSAEDENAFIERNGWKGYGDWHLGIDEDADEETKERYSFPYGDFRRVHRSGLIAAKQRAAQFDHDDVEKAADELLANLDESSG
jgi:hypothetical protein